MSSLDESPGRESQELIAFRIGEQEFCVDVNSVREIRMWTPETPVPHAPAYIRGVVNLRGTVLPIIDLAARLGLGKAGPDMRHVIIVFQCWNRPAGLLVEAVSDIITISDDDIHPVPETSSDIERQYARGIVAIDDRMICMIDLDALFPQKESQTA